VKTQTQILGNDHERTDAHVAPLVQFIITMTVICVASFYAMKLLLGWFKAHDTAVPGNERHPLAEERVIPPEPRLEALQRAMPGIVVRDEGRADESRYHTQQNRQVIRAKDDQQLGTYGWIDKQAKITHIPIEKAKELLVKQGLPVAK